MTAPPPRLRVWSLPLSLALHVAAFATLGWGAPAAPPPPPQIMLLAPSPLPPSPQEAQPSPAEAPVMPTPSLAATEAATEPPQPPEDLTPLAAETPAAETAVAAPPPEKPPLRKPDPRIAPQRPQPVRHQRKERSEVQTQAAALPFAAQGPDAHAAPDAAPRAAPAGPPPDYLGLIVARIERAKRYPPEARAARQEGTARVRFTLDRSGALARWRLEKSSGVAALDAEAGEMLRRAAPFPPFPADISRDQIELSAPVEFSLRDP